MVCTYFRAQSLTEFAIMGMIILAFAYDAFVGLQILRTIFTKENDENDTENKDNLIKCEEENELTAESFNCRLPSFLK
jgi:hypothetical protein